MINHKSLFSSVRMDQSQREGEGGCALNLLSRCLFSSQFSHFCPTLFILSPLLSFWRVFFRGTSKQSWNGPYRDVEKLISFLGGCAQQAFTWRSIFSCAHINDSVAYWNCTVGSSGEIAEEFRDSGQNVGCSIQAEALKARRRREVEQIPSSLNITSTLLSFLSLPSFE